MRFYKIRRNFLFLATIFIFPLLLLNPWGRCEGLSAIQEAEKEVKQENKSVCHSTKEKLDFFFEIIRTRRTVREFSYTPVPEEDIIKVLDMARYAPTAGNQQTWKFVVVRDSENLKALKENLKAWWKERLLKEDLKEKDREKYLNSGHEQIDRIMTAPVYIFIFADTNVYGEYALHDGCLAAENLMLAARALGYGTGFFTSYFPEEKVKEFLHAPKSLKFICATPLGIPKEWPEMKPKKKLKDFIVYEKFAERTNP